MKIMGYYPETRDLSFQKEMYRRLNSILWYRYHEGRYEYIQHPGSLEKEYQKMNKNKNLDMEEA